MRLFSCDYILGDGPVQLGLFAEDRVMGVVNLDDALGTGKMQVTSPRVKSILYLKDVRFVYGLTETREEFLARTGIELDSIYITLPHVDVDRSDAAIHEKFLRTDILGITQPTREDIYTYIPSVEIRDERLSRMLKDERVKACLFVKPNFPMPRMCFLIDDPLFIAQILGIKIPARPIPQSSIIHANAPAPAAQQ